MSLQNHTKFLGLGFMFVALAACSSSGGSVTSGVANSAGAIKSSAKAKRATGETIAEYLKAGKIAQADSKSATGIQIRGSDGSALAAAPATFQVRNNYVGGLDVSVQGDIINLTQTEVKPDLNSWGKSGTGYSLALWNAGRGGREGLFRDEEGQVYHKIIGYRHDDTKDDVLTLGHSIIGIKTAASALPNLPRTIRYDGYFFANAMPGATPQERDTVGTVGGLRIDANFDTETVSGSSTSFDVKRPTDLGSLPSGDTLRFTGNINGTAYTGNIVSSQPQLNGATINGQFYGASAQETAGVIIGQNASGSTQGFFTATDTTQ